MSLEDKLKDMCDTTDIPSMSESRAKFLFGKSSDIVYHGSNVIVKNPEKRASMYTKDFGYGFYVTKFIKQAETLAGRRSIRHGKPVINCYNINPDYVNCKYLKFNGTTDDWLDFIARCRSGESHNYDIVEGPMADDDVWDYVDDYLAGRITKDAFLALCKFKKPTHQIVLCNDDVISRYITFRCVIDGVGR